MAASVDADCVADVDDVVPTQQHIASVEADGSSPRRPFDSDRRHQDRGDVTPPDWREARVVLETGRVEHRHLLKGAHFQGGAG